MKSNTKEGPGFAALMKKDDEAETKVKVGTNKINNPDPELSAKMGYDVEGNEDEYWADAEKDILAQRAKAKEPGPVEDIPEPKLSGSKSNYIKCPNCGRVSHKTTTKYRKVLDARPDMPELLPKLAALGWNGPPPDKSAGYGSIVCPSCDCLLAPSGKFTVVQLTKKGLRDAVSSYL